MQLLVHRLTWRLRLKMLTSTTFNPSTLQSHVHILSYGSFQDYRQDKAGVHIFNDPTQMEYMPVACRFRLEVAEEPSHVNHLRGLSLLQGTQWGAYARPVHRLVADLSPLSLNSGHRKEVSRPKQRQDKMQRSVDILSERPRGDNSCSDIFYPDR